MNEVSSILVALSCLDAEITAFDMKEKAILSERQKFATEVKQLEQALAQVGASHAAATERQAAEEAKLRDEQRKIVERRKQLSALGGSKSARLLEREVDVAGRAIVQLEAKVVATLEEVEKLDRKRQETQLNLEVKQQEKDTLEPGWADTLATVKESVTSKKKEREANLLLLTPPIRQTYTRVGSRYPGSAVARAEGGSCKACFRALPAQVFNSVLMGKELVQCPGCSRILVSSELFPPKDGAEASKPAAVVADAA